MKILHADFEEGAVLATSKVSRLFLPSKAEMVGLTIQLPRMVVWTLFPLTRNGNKRAA